MIFIDWPRVKVFRLSSVMCHSQEEEEAKRKHKMQKKEQSELSLRQHPIKSYTFGLT